MGRKGLGGALGPGAGGENGVDVVEMELNFHGEIAPGCGHGISAGAADRVDLGELPWERRVDDAALAEPYTPPVAVSNIRGQRALADMQPADGRPHAAIF